MKKFIREFIVNYTARASQLRKEAKQFNDRQMKRDSLVSAHMYDVVIGELKEILSGETVKLREGCEHHWLPVGDWDGILFDQCTKCNLFREHPE